MKEKYSHIPIEHRERHRLRDISDYLDGRIDLDELHYREYGEWPKVSLKVEGQLGAQLVDLFNVYNNPFVWGWMLGWTMGIVAAVIIQALGLK